MTVFDFNPDTIGYSPENALFMGENANLAYADRQKIESQVQKWQFDKFAFFERRETQAYVAANSKMVVVAFRGTEPIKLKDWMTDVDIDLVDGPAGKVHEGFRRALRYVWPEMKETINRFQDNAQSLWFTGHSLGAALATLAVADLRLVEDKPVNGLYTFGSPRVGDRTFARNFNLEARGITYRFVNNNDVVTRVPLRAMKYSHVGKFLYFDAAGDFHDDIHWWNKFLERVKGRIDDLLRPGTDGIKDHDMDRYEKNLGRNLGLDV